MSKKDGGSAFPGHTIDGRPTPGISLRDYFAGQAVTGTLVASGDLNIGISVLADLAYNIADAMLKAREDGS